MNQIEVTGMVLSVAPIGEYDRRVVLLTKERGKISAFAKGARKPNSALVGMTTPFTFGIYSLYAGRNSYTITSARIENYFAKLGQNMEGAYYGFYFLEIANYYCREENNEVEMLKLLYQTLRALEQGRIPFPLIRCIYELKAVAVNGEAPQVFQCVNCGEKTGNFLFSTAKSGIVCEKCKREVIDGISIGSSALYSMQYIISSKIEKLYTFTVTPEVLKQLQKVMKSYLQMHVDKEFKSLKILSELNELGTGTI